MAEIDLIPHDYRKWRERQRLLLRSGVALVALNAAIVAAALGVEHRIDEQRARAAELNVNNTITEQQQARLEELDAKQTEFERRWSLLRGLRAGAAVDDVFTLIDRALVPGDLWFLDWSFRRAGIVVNGQTRGIETGYFIIVDQEQPAPGKADLSIETHMTIHGQARDHQALSTFVRALFDQDDIKDVNVQKTARVGYAGGQVVDFDMTIVLNSKLGSS
jgi:Tfp pilus assembly protein PilN